MTDYSVPPGGPEADTTPSRRPRRPPAVRRRDAVLRFLRDVVVIVVVAVLISFLIKTFLIRSFYIPSESMERTLLVNDRIIVNQLTPGLMPISRGDIVVFRDPGGWLGSTPHFPLGQPAATIEWILSFVGLTAPDSNDHLIKRVIGLPGDTVACCDEYGRLTINGVPIEEPYLRLSAGVTKASGIDFEVTVPEDALWVLGDNRYASADSRLNRDKPGDGFVPYENVVGRAILISWPIERWTWLDNHAFVFSGVGEAGAADISGRSVSGAAPGPGGD